MERSATPGNQSPNKQALKGRNGLTTPFALSGLGFFAWLPRALPWAISFSPFRAIIEWSLLTTHLHHAIRNYKSILTAKTQRAQRKTRNPAFSAASLRTWRLRGKDSLLPSYSVKFRVRPWLMLLILPFLISFRG